MVSMAVLVAALTVSGCDRPPEPRVLVPTARLVEHAEADGPEGARASLSGVSRPVLFASEARPVRGCREREQGDRCTVRVPAVSAPWMIVESVSAEKGQVGEVWRMLQPAAGDRPWVPAVVPAGGPVQVRAVSALESRDVLTAPVAIPPAAVLRFAGGVEEAAWTLDTAPVALAVAIVGDDGEREIFRRQLDPAGRPDDRGWFEEEVDLGAFGDTTARLRFTARPAVPGDHRPSLPLWGDPTVLARAGRRGGAPHVVLVSLDTLRARSVGSYGHDRDTTPNLDALARQGVLFEQAITPYPNTLPSHMSLMTGLYPRTHQIRVRAARLGAEYPLLAERLRAGGYMTAAFTEDGLVLATAGFRRGFARYHEDKSEDVEKGAAPETFRRALDWVRGHTDQPFFLFVHTYQVHAPHTPPEPYRSYFGDAAPVGLLEGGERLSYEQEIRFLDDQLRVLLDGLDALVPPDRFLLVVTADHGEEFFEHGLPRHSQLYEEVLRVPLVMRWPGVIPAGLRIAAPVSLVDVVPTILELVGRPPLPAAEGVSLVPLLHGPPGRSLERPAVFAETRRLNAPDRIFAGRTATHKCILHAHKEQWKCYDLVQDPEERHPLESQAFDSLAGLRASIERYRGRATDAPAPVNAGIPDPQTEQRLRALGYVD
jgi:arylsulfatase A-like enzyme